MNGELIRACARYFGFAARLYLREPSKEALQACRTLGEVLTAELPEQEFPGLFASVPEGSVEALRQEYFDLFFVPMSGCYLPPYEVAQRTDPNKAEAVDGLRRLYAGTGFDPARLEAPSYLRTLNRSDYIGFELAFASALLESAAEAPMGEEVALLATFERFREKHLGTWTSAYGRQVREWARSPLFQALGGLTTFLADEAASGLAGEAGRKQTAC